MPIRFTLVLCLLFSWSLPSTFSAEPIKEIASGNAIPVLWGKVVDKKGQPIAGANVQWNPMNNMSDIISQLSDAGGNVMLTEPKERKKEDYVICRHPDYATFGLCHVKSKKYDSNHLFEIQLSTGPSLNVKVLDLGQKGLADVEVGLKVPVKGNDHTHDVSDFEVSHSDAKGEAHFPMLHEGDLKITLNKQGWVSLKEHAINHDAKGKLHTLHMVPGKSIKVNVEDPSSTKAKPKVTMSYGFSANKLEDFKDLKNKFSLAVTSGESFQIPLSGYLQLKVDTKKNHDFILLNEELASLTSLDIKLKLLKVIKGKVLSLEDGQPINNASLKARYHLPNTSGTRSTYAKSNNKGDFEFYLDHEGEVTLEAWTKDYALESLTVAEKDLKTPVIFKLDRGEDAHFRLLQPIPYSEPAILSERELKITIKPSSQYHNAKYTTDKDGLLTVAGIKKGDQVELNVPGYVKQDITPDPQGRRLDILLLTATTLQVKVQDEDGQSLTRAYFRNQQNTTIDKTFNKNTNIYELKGLTSGSFTLEILHTGYQSKTLTLDLSLYGNALQVVELTKKPVYSFILKNIDALSLPPTISLKIFDPLASYNSSRTLRPAKESELPTYEYTSDQRLEAESVELTVKGYLPLTLKILPHQFSYTCELEKGLGFTAQINDENGLPIPNVSVEVRDNHHRHSSQFTSDSLGIVNASGLYKRIYSVELNKSPFSELEVQVDMMNPPVSPIWVMSKGGTCQLSILTSTGTPAESVKATLQKNQGWGFSPFYQNGKKQEITTDQNGQATLEGLNPGSYQWLIVGNPLGSGESKPFDIKAGETIRMTMDLKPAHSITGIVVDETGAPIPEVNLNLLQANGRYLNIRVESDSQGNFVFEGVKNEPYMVSWSHSDYESMEPKVTLNPGEEIHTLVMKPITWINVKVTLPDSVKPEKATLSKVDIRLFSKHLTHQYESELHHPDFDGEFYRVKSSQFSQESSDSFQIVAKYVGYNPGESKAFQRSSLPKVLEIALKPELKINFKVQNSIGEALSQVGVEYKKMNSADHSSTENWRQFSDDQGKLSLTGLPEAHYEFTFTHASYAKTTVEYPVSSEPSVEHLVTLTKGAQLWGTVSDAKGKPMIKAQVTLSAINSHSFDQNLRAESDTKGMYRITGIPEGDYQVSFHKAQVRSWGNNSRDPVVIHLNSGQNLQKDLQEPTVENAGRLEVEVPSDASFQNVMLVNPSNGTSSAGIREGDIYVFDAVPAGVYRLMLMGTSGMKNLEVEIKEGETTTLKVNLDEPYTLKAEFRDSKGQIIFQGMAMLLPNDLDIGSDMSQMPANMNMAKINAGKVSMGIPSAGTFKLVLYLTQAGAMRTKTVENIQIVSEGITDLGIIQLEEGQTLSGQVVDELGNPLSGVRIMAMKDGAPLSSGQNVSRDTGDFEIKGLPEAPFTLLAFHSQKATLKMEVNSFNPLSLRMSTGASIQVQLLGQDIMGRRVDIVNEDETPIHTMWNGFNGQNKLSGSQGEITFEHVTPGKYRIKVSPKGNSSEDIFSEPFDAMDGLPTLVNIGL